MCWLLIYYLEGTIMAYLILLRCIDENQAQELMRELHEEICGGHFSPTATAHNIIRAGFYWP
jgi:hypothetical protein